MEPLIKKSVRKPGFSLALNKSTESKSDESLEESDTALTSISTIARKRKHSSSQTKWSNNVFITQTLRTRPVKSNPTQPSLNEQQTNFESGWNKTQPRRISLM